MTLVVVAGDGGNGCVAFHRERFAPRGGPAGGDGGDGGSVVFAADPGLGTLLDLHLKRRLCADAGEHGMGRDRYGRSGKDLVQRVPVGTTVTNAKTGERIADLTAPGQRAVIARGGRGGRGNIHFATPSNQAPGHAEEGEPGEELRVRVELRLLAEVGIVGFPNVGKSTLISRLSAARPKVADYPFTTLVPNLGVVAWRDGQSFVVADMPGLIEGAHAGHGLGHRFLRHVERCRCLLHVITVDADIEGREPLRDLEVIELELERYDSALAARPTVIGLSKIDLPHVREVESTLREALGRRASAFVAFSAVTGEGMERLVDALGDLVIRARDAQAQAETT